MLRFVATKQFNKFLVRGPGLRFSSNVVRVNSSQKLTDSYTLKELYNGLVNINTQLGGILAQMERQGARMERVQRELDQMILESIQYRPKTIEYVSYVARGMATVAFYTIVIKICLEQ